MAKKTRKEGAAVRDSRINIKLLSPEELNIYLGMKHLAVDLRMPLKRLVLQTFAERLARSGKKPI